MNMRKFLVIFSVFLLLSSPALADSCSNIPACTGNQASQWNGSEWKCVNASSGTLTCRIVESTGSPTCNSDEALTGGGGHAPYGGGQCTNDIVMSASMPTGNSWLTTGHNSCGGGTATSIIICCKIS